jgi:hypothetical protein
MSAAQEPRPLAGAAERIRQLLVTAESVAEDIRREAAEEAERYLAQRRRETDATMAAQRDQLEQALGVLRSAGPDIQHRLNELTSALEQALEGAAGQPVAAPPPVQPAEPEPASPAPAAPQPEAPAAPQPEAPAADPVATESQRQTDTSHVRQRALIRATQLAVQGADRQTVQQTLEREFELDDAGPIVSEILGDA